MSNFVQMKKWEYSFAYYTYDIKSELINTLGNEGWELIEVLRCYEHPDSKMCRWLFKREKIESVNPIEGD